MEGLRLTTGIVVIFGTFYRVNEKVDLYLIAIDLYYTVCQSQYYFYVPKG